VLARKAEEEAGQASLFGGAEDQGGLARQAPPLPDVPEWEESDRLKREKEALGFFISGHPLDRFRDLVQAFDHVNSRSLQEYAGQKVELACVVTGVARQISKRDNSEWGKITVEDFHGTATVLAFKDVWQACKEALQTDAVILLRGQVSGRERDEEDPPIFLDEVQPLEELPASGLVSLQIELPLGGSLGAAEFAHARAVLSAHPGATPVEVTVGQDNGIRAPRLRSRTLRADVSNGTLKELREIFGAGRVRLVRRGVGQEA